MFLKRFRLYNWKVRGDEESINEEFLFVESIRDSFLYQHFLKETRGKSTSTLHILDLLFTNEEEMVRDLTYESPLGKSDHCVLNFNFVCHTEHSVKKHKLFYYDKGDYDSMKVDIKAELDSKTISLTDNPNRQWEVIKESIKKMLSSIYQTERQLIRQNKATLPERQ